MALQLYTSVDHKGQWDSIYRPRLYDATGYLHKRNTKCWHIVSSRIQQNYLTKYTWCCTPCTC